MEIERIIQRLERALRATTWRHEFGLVDPASVLAAEECLGGALPEDLRYFLSRTLVLENRPGDVFFMTAKDCLDAESAFMSACLARRQADEISAGPYPEAREEVRTFWDGAVPFLVSTVNGENLLAVDVGRAGCPVIEIWDDGTAGEAARVCASSFADFLEAFTLVVERGAPAFDVGWRLTRATLDVLRARDPAFHEPLLPLLFETDFLGRSPISTPPASLASERGGSSL